MLSRIPKFGASSHTFVRWHLGQFETNPIVVNGVLYGAGQDDRAFALDGRTGRAIGRYRGNLPNKIPLCRGAVNRGFAMLGNKLSIATLDAHVVALEAKTGDVIWDVVAAGYHSLKHELIGGVSGGESGTRGFIDAYDADTGRGL